MDQYETHYLTRLGELTMAFEKKVADMTVERTALLQRLDVQEEVLNTLRDRVGDLEIRLAAYDEVPPPDETIA
jgi:hypothetical protein